MNDRWQCVLLEQQEEIAPFRRHEVLSGYLWFLLMQDPAITVADTTKFCVTMSGMFTVVARSFSVHNKRGFP